MKLSHILVSSSVDTYLLLLPQQQVCVGKLKGRCQSKQVSCEFNIHNLIQQIRLILPTNGFTPYCICRKPPQASVTVL